MSEQTEAEQQALWNGVAGRGWVEAQDVLDEMMRPLEERLVGFVRAISAGTVLDVGCGTGGTTLACARALESSGQLRSSSQCTGIDISEPMISAARTRAEQEGTAATFILADAQSHAFEPESFDVIVSRFGVMFFDDSVRAFTNLRHAARAGGRLRFLAWRSAEENPFLTTAERAAAPLLPNMPPRRAEGPGPFAFADESRVASMLEQSGWEDIDIQSIDFVCRFPERDLVTYVMHVGPLARVIEATDSQLREQVFKTVRAAFDPYVQGSEMRFTAACWEVSARSPAS